MNEQSSNSPSSQTRSEEAPSRKRRPRQPLSCAECRRLKLKCDREAPCANCVKRGCQDICPNGARLPSKANHEETSELRSRLETLEGMLRASTSSGMLDRPQPPSVERDEGALIVKRVRLDTGSAQPSFATPHVDIGRSEAGIHMRHDRLHTDPVLDLQAPPREPDQSASFVPSSFDEPLLFDFSTPRLDKYAAPQGQSSSDGILERSATQLPPQGLGHGTLVMSKSGASSRYYGHTAASEWLKDQEYNEAGESASPWPSRMPSPERTQIVSTQDTFPFTLDHQPTRTANLMAGLPDEDEARVLVDCYFRYFAWHYDVAPRPSIEVLLTEIYAVKARGVAHLVLDPRRLALLFVILAVGSLHNLELPPNDPSAEEYLNLAKRSLAKSDFMTNSTIEGVQTLHIMAHYHLSTEKGRNGDSAWPLWGLAMRLLQAMGFHRDGSRWNLDGEVVEARRRVFWESYSADIFQANCFSRPSSIAPQYIDTAFPESPKEGRSDHALRHDLLKFELSKISAQVLDHAMRVDAPPYTNVASLHDKLISFERDVPYGLRCRAVLMALPSLYPDPEQAVRDSPELTRKDLRKTLQQFTLALNISESLLFLHRPYFARALHERRSHTTFAEYGQSYICVVERCNVMIQICAAIYPLHPGVVSRHWHFWYHVFNAAVCMGTLILQDPRNLLASYALSIVDSAISLYTNIVQSLPTPRLVKNLEWLLKLRQRAQARIISAAASGEGDGTDSEEGADVELIGWRTRLVQRLGKGVQTATTITPAQSATTPSPATTMARTITQALQKHFVPEQPLHASQPGDPSILVQDSATDALLHQFWDPMMLQDQSSSAGDLMASVDWWNLDPSGLGGNEG